MRLKQISPFMGSPVQLSAESNLNTWINKSCGRSWMNKVGNSISNEAVLSAMAVYALVPRFKRCPLDPQKRTSVGH
jgi:hypothetical protein